jgi:hypothetical protein
LKLAKILNWALVSMFDYYLSNFTHFQH